MFDIIFVKIDDFSVKVLMECKIFPHKLYLNFKFKHSLEIKTGFPPFALQYYVFTFIARITYNIFILVVIKKCTFKADVKTKILVSDA